MNLKDTDTFYELRYVIYDTEENDRVEDYGTEVYKSEEEVREHVDLIKLCTKNRYRGEITVFKWVKQNYEVKNK